MTTLSIVPDVQVHNKVTETGEHYTEVILDYSQQIILHVEKGGRMQDLELETTWVETKDLKGDYFTLGVKI